MTAEGLPARVEGQGLVLRQWVRGDAEQLGALIQRNLDHLRPWMAWIAHEPLGIEQRRELIEGWHHEWADGGDAVYGIFVDGEPVGGCGFHRRIGPNGLELGYWVDGGRLGQGIARRASSLLTTTAFDVPGIDVVEIHHDVTNERSRRVPESLGFHEVGVVASTRPLAPADTGTDAVWRVGRQEWRSRRESSG